MKKVFTTHVGDNGTLTVSVPVGKDYASNAVRVTVETLETPPDTPMDRETWRRLIQETAGSISDPTFERHPQGEFEDRESLG